MTQKITGPSYFIVCSLNNFLVWMQAPCGLHGCKNRAQSVSLPEVIKDVPIHGVKTRKMFFSWCVFRGGRLTMLLVVDDVIAIDRLQG